MGRHGAVWVQTVPLVRSLGKYGCMGDAHSALLPALPPHFTQQKGKSEFERHFFLLLCKRVCPKLLLLLHIFPSIMFGSVLIKVSSDVVIFYGLPTACSQFGVLSNTSRFEWLYHLCVGLSCVCHFRRINLEKNTQDSYCTAILSRRRGISVCGQTETAETRSCK